MIKTLLRCVLSVIILFVGLSYSQKVAEDESLLTTSATATGVTPLGTYEFGSIDAISLQNGTLTLKIPLISVDGRQIDMGLSLIYNSMIWSVRDGATPDGRTFVYYKPAGGGWELSIPRMRYRNLSTYYDTEYTEYTLMDNGAAHHFTNVLKIVNSTGATRTHVQKGYSYDSSYMTFNTPNSSNTNYVLKRDGTAIIFGGLFGRPSRYPLKIRDKNGNFIRFFLGSEEGFTGAAASLVTSIEDTLGRRIRFNHSDSGDLSSIEYTDANGSIQRIQFQYGTRRVEWDGHDWESENQSFNYEANALSKIILPNGLKYEFEYDTALNQGRGQLTSVILPTGGRLRYTYGKCELPGEPLYHDVVSKKEVIENQISNAWQYQYDSAGHDIGSYPLTTSVIDPLGNQTKTTFSYTTSRRDILEAQRLIYEGSAESGRLLRKVSLAWDTSDSFPGPVSGSVSQFGVCVNPRVTNETTILYDTSPREGHAVSYAYRMNSNPRYCPDGNPIEISDRKFAGEVYVPGSSTLLKKRLLEYSHSTNIRYYNSNLLDLLSKETTLDSSGNTVSEQRYEYDSFPLATNTAIHYETPLNVNFRGNLTRSIGKIFSGSDIVTEAYYDSFGNVIKSKDPNGNETSYTYTPSYQFAYPETITNAKGQRTTNTYSSFTGALLSSTDPNGNRTEYSYDLMGRLRETRTPDGGGASYTYNESLPLSITTSIKLSTNQSLASNTLYDGLGRPYLTRTTDPEGDVVTDTSYDPLGRKARESTPHRDGEGLSFTSYQYDALGRILKSIHPDGNYTECQYSGHITKTYDQTGRWRELQYDPLGNLISVNDNGLNTTSYQYDVLGNLLRVVQGDRIRTSAYDSLGRLISESHPESGTAGYTYDSNSNLIDNVDSKSIHTSHAYDSLNRILSTSYSDATPAVSYYYDGANPLSVSSQNPQGRLTGTSTQRMKEAFSYDKMGGLIKEVKEIDGQRFEISYAYDLAGNLVSEIYPSGRVVSREINSAGRTTRLRDETRFRDIVSAVSYAPFGAVKQKNYGNGIVNSVYFNDRLQPTRIQHGNVLDLSYVYYDAGGGNNGNVNGIIDNLYGNKSASYTYDALNRLISTSSPAWSQLFSYDIYGNMLSKQGAGSAPSASFNYTQKNQIIGLGYDANGNLTNDGLNSFAYDANDKIKATGIHAYVYDADGHRSIKEKNIVPTESNYYVYDKNGLPIAEYVKTGAGPICWMKDLIYFGLDLVQSAENPSPQTFSLPPADLVLYYHQDHLGNTRVVTGQNGSTVETHDFYPFGEENATQPLAKDQYLFTGKKRDAESGLDYFGARYYSSKMGRFVSADDPAEIEDAAIEDPQQWNLYIYCGNNPITRVDLDGKTFWDLIDIASFADSVVKFVKKPSWGGALNVALDGVGLLPGIPGIGTVKKAINLVDKADDVKDAVITTSKVADTTKGVVKKVHGNTVNDAPAVLYKKVDKYENFRKYGVTNRIDNSNKRYTRKQLKDGKCIPVEYGPRNEMIKKERKLVETNPGPENKEKWAGKKTRTRAKPEDKISR